jgi:hypothetical protein
MQDRDNNQTVGAIEPWEPPPTAATARRRWSRRVGVGVCAVVAIGGLAVGIALKRESDRIWRELRASSARFAPPTGWERIGSAEQGKTFCVISCDEARVTLVFRASETPSTACDNARRAVYEQIGRTESLGGPCTWVARASSIGDDGKVIVNAETVQTLPANLRPRGFARGVGRGNPTFVTITFSSGIE